MRPSSIVFSDCLVNSTFKFFTSAFRLTSCIFWRRKKVQAHNFLFVLTPWNCILWTWQRMFDLFCLWTRHLANWKPYLRRFSIQSPIISEACLRQCISSQVRMEGFVCLSPTVVVYKRALELGHLINYNFRQQNSQIRLNLFIEQTLNAWHIVQSTEHGCFHNQRQLLHKLANTDSDFNFLLISAC